MRETKTFQFKQPGGLDKYRIEDQNSNWRKADKLFRQFKKREQINFLLIVLMFGFSLRNKAIFPLKQLIVREAQKKTHLSADNGSR